MGLINFFKSKGDRSRPADMSEELRLSPSQDAERCDRVA